MIRKENVDAVVDPAREAFEVGSPPQVVDSDEEVVAGHESIPDVKSLIAGAAAIDDVLVERIVSSEARVERIVAGQFEVQFRPSTTASDFLASKQIDSLADAAYQIAEVSTPPAFTADRDDFCDRKHIVKIA